MPPTTDLQLGVDPAMRDTILLVAVYLVVALGGVLAHAYGVRFARLGLGVSILAALMLIQVTVLREPILAPVAIVGLTMTGLAGAELRGVRQRDR